MLMSLNAVGKGRPDEIERYYEYVMLFILMYAQWGPPSNFSLDWRFDIFDIVMPLKILS